MFADNKRSVHISYQPQNQRRLHNALFYLINKAAKESRATPEKFTIADLGCGRGELIMGLHQKGYKVVGLDSDPNCVELSKANGKVEVILGSVEKVADLFADIHVDMFILSHVLEHTHCPLKVIQGIKSHPAPWLCLAVPNPVRPKIFMKYHLKGSDYANKGHLYSWDRSHFRNFIENYCGLTIHAWAIDEVYSFPYVRNLLNLIRLTDPLEVNILPKLFPYLSSSLITLCGKA